MTEMNSEIPYQHSLNKPLSNDEIEASGDALVVASALYAVADAINGLAEKMFAGVGEPEGPEDGSYGSYLDGSPVR